MTPGQRWARIQELFENMEEASPEEREFQLAAEEADLSIREAVLALFEATEREAEANARHVRGEGMQELSLPVRIGSYGVTRVIGQGGTSSVYEGLREVGEDLPQPRPVAIKVLHSFFTSEEQRQRFEREHQILTRLDHPGICRLLDGGLTAERKPYLVLELLNGQPIDVYCNEREFGVEARILLVLQACEALAAAHRALIVHLDLKPAHLVVDVESHLKVLDFGTAKLLDPLGGLTTTKQLTPLYASPEQLRGEAVSTSCDIYSMGMILYELLAGAPAFDGATLASVAERASGASTMRRMADKISPEAARQRALSADRLRAKLSGDIEYIVAKSLSFEPGRRYLTMQALAEDLRRYLEQRPVLARRQTFRYRARKYAMRRWKVLTVVSVLLVGLVTASAYAWRQQQVALEEGLRAKSSVKFLEWMISSSSPMYGGRKELMVVEMVERAEQRLARGDLKDPRTTAQMEGMLGGFLFGSGREANGFQTLKRARSRAIESGDESARVLTGIGLGSAYLSRGDCPNAIRSFADVDAWLKKDHGERSIVDQASFLVSRDGLRMACEQDSSGKLIEQAVALLPKIADDSSETAMPARLFKALVLNAHVRVLSGQKKFAEAIRSANEALQFVNGVADSGGVQVALLNSRAVAEYAGGDVASAGRTLLKASELAETVSTPFERIRFKVMAGQRIAEAGDKALAIRLADQALEQVKLAGADLEQTRWMILVDAATTYMRADKCEAVPPLLKAIDEQTGGKMPTLFKANRLGVEAVCLSRGGEVVAAKARAREAIDVAGKAWSPTGKFRVLLEKIAASGFG